MCCLGIIVVSWVSEEGEVEHRDVPFARALSAFGVASNGAWVASSPTVAGVVI